MAQHRVGFFPAQHGGQVDGAKNLAGAIYCRLQFFGFVGGIDRAGRRWGTVREQLNQVILGAFAWD
jgi:hypothetical protein